MPPPLSRREILCSLHPESSSAAVRSADWSRGDMLSVRHKSVNCGVGKSLFSPNWWDQIDRLVGPNRDRARKQRGGWNSACQMLTWKTRGRAWVSTSGLRGGTAFTAGGTTTMETPTITLQVACSLVARNTAAPLPKWRAVPFPARSARTHRDIHHPKALKKNLPRWGLADLYRGL